MLPAPIQRIPVGLLDYLQIQSLGKNPTVLSEVVQPTIDLWKLYSASRWESTSYVGTPVAANGAFNPDAATVANVTVPFNEYWLIDDCTFEIGLGGATTAQCQGSWNIPAVGGSLRHYWSEFMPLPIAAGQSYFLRCRGEDFILPPGSAPVLNVTGFAGAAISWIGRVRFIRLRT